MSNTTLREQIMTALAGVQDPEIRRPITQLGMVESVSVDKHGKAVISVLLTVPGCPLQDTLESDVKSAAQTVDGVTAVDVRLGVMNDEQRAAMRAALRPQNTSTEDHPAQHHFDNTRVIAVASGKGGVGKSSLTVNLAVALAARGLKVGLLDADIYGHSVPAMMGIADERPTIVDDMIMPIPAFGVPTMSIGLMKESREQVIAWRGPMLDRALTQLLGDVFWGDLDVLLVDLPPGTGDMAMSVARQLPKATVIVVTTPNAAAYEVAERAGTMAGLLKQPVLGVVENMSWLDVDCPNCGQPHRVDLFGSGGGAATADALTQRLGEPVPLLAQIPLDVAVRAGGDDGRPVVVAAPDSVSAQAITALAAKLA